MAHIARDVLNGRMRTPEIAPAHWWDSSSVQDAVVMLGQDVYAHRDQEQLRQLATFQRELSANYGKLAAVSADPPLAQAAFRAGLGAEWPFLSDVERTLIQRGSRPGWKVAPVATSRRCGP